MIKINIHGSCVSRDIFRFDQNELYKIINYIGRNSIISLSYPPVNLNVFENVIDSRRLAWEERMIYYDSKKLAFDKIVDGCDYLLIDLIDERFGILESDVGCLTYSQVLQRSEHMKSLYPYKIRDIHYDTKEFYDAYNKYALFLREHFNVNKIIIHEAYPVSVYLGKDQALHSFNSEELKKNDKLCIKIKRGYELLETFLPEAQVLQMPCNTIAFEEHMWGKSTVHYTYTYYMEMLKKINNIVMI